jgi:hypothetical protein
MTLFDKKNCTNFTLKVIRKSEDYKTIPRGEGKSKYTRKQELCDFIKKYYKKNYKKKYKKKNKKKKKKKKIKKKKKRKGNLDRYMKI